MCTSQAGCRILRQKSVTLMETIVVVLIIAVLATIGYTGWQWEMEREHAQNAQTMLKLILQAEENYFAWKDNYTPDWAALAIDNPNDIDKFYNYTVEEATHTTLKVEAIRCGSTNGFCIDQDGNITKITK